MPSDRPPGPSAGSTGKRVADTAAQTWMDMSLLSQFSHLLNGVHDSDILY